MSCKLSLNNMTSNFILKPQGLAERPPAGLKAWCSGGSAMVSKMPKLQDLAWTYSRDVLPPQLSYSGVSLELWQEAWDLVYHKMEAEFKMNEEIVIYTRGSCPGCILCCLYLTPGLNVLFICGLCCYGICQSCSREGPGEVEKMRLQNDQEWIDVCNNVSGLFHEYNIAVTLATEERVQTSGSKKNRVTTTKKVNVGLQFDVVHPPTQTENAS